MLLYRLTAFANKINVLVELLEILFEKNTEY